MDKALRESKPVDVLLAEYQPWDRAVDIWKIFVANNNLEELREFLLASCPNGLSQSDLNLILSFEICALGSTAKTREEERAEEEKLFNEYCEEDDFFNDLLNDDDFEDSSESDKIISDSVEKLEDGVKVIKIPNGVQRIGVDAFVGRYDIKSITIPDSVIRIGRSAFCWCRAIESMVIPKNVTNIGETAFLDCTKLTSITIPESETIIEHRAFEGCSSLSEINYEGTKEAWEAIKKERCWRRNSGIRAIKCADGIIKLRKS